MTQKDKFISNVVGISIVIGFILPHTISPILLYINPLIVVFFKIYNKEKSYYFNSVVLVALFIPLLLNLAQGITFKSIQIWATICLCFFCFPFVGRIKVHNIYIYITFVLIFVSQIASLFQISFLIDIIDRLYPMNEYMEGALTYMAENITLDNYTTFRLGGIYRNSNSCSEALCMLLGFFIANNKKIEKSTLLFMAIMMYAIIITGSRTGFIVSSLMISLFFILNRRFAYILPVGIVFILFIIFGGNSELRVFEVQEGLSGSLSTKSDTFVSYISNEESPIKLLFGYFDAVRYRTMAQLGFMKTFDSDYGTLIFSYGFVGFFVILLFLYTVFKRVGKHEKICFVLLLWMSSATIFKSFRMIFLFMLLLSIIYSNCLESEKKSNNIQS